MVMDRRGGDKAQFIEQSKVRHILVRTSETVSEAQAEATIRDLYQQIDNGADFAVIAREHSDDPVSGSDGGNLGWVSPGQMVPEFDQVVFSAPVNEVQGPVKTQFGYHLLEVTSRTD